MANREGENLNKILEEKMRAKGIDAAQLAQGTDIPERYCASLIAGEYHKLPPPPYVRGYLGKIAALLDMDGEALWQAYLKENPGMKTSGTHDRFPTNRFAIKKITKRGVIFLIIAVFAILYAVYFAEQASRAPRLTVVYPSSDTTIAALPSIELRGWVGVGDKLKINGEEVPVSRDGEFIKTISLSPGMNSIVFRASRFFGGERTIVRQVVYQP